MKQKISRAFEMLSALQKSIRRSETDEAGYWFFGLCESGFVSMAVNRLRVIAHEDIGLADAEALSLALRCCDDASAWFNGKNDAWMLAAANAIIVMCDARKSRQAVHFQAVCRYRFKQYPNNPVPDFALDKHTRRGKQMGRGYDHFFAEAARLIDPDGTEAVTDVWQAEAIQAFKSGVLDARQAADEGDKGLFNEKQTRTVGN